MAKRYTVSGRQAPARPRCTGPQGRKRLTPRQVAFVETYLECGNAAEAYRRNYRTRTANDLTTRRNAQTLLRQPLVEAYLAERQAEIRERHSVTVDSVNDEINEALSIARDERNPSAMVSALTLRARLHGLLVDKREHSGPGGGPIESVHRFERDQIDAVLEAAE